MSTRPGPRRPRVLLRRALASALAACALLAVAAPAHAAPLVVAHRLGPQGSALSTPLIVHDDFEAARTLSGGPALAPAGAAWATTGGSWFATGGAAAPSTNTTALTVDGGTPAVDVTAVLQSPSTVFGLITLLGTVRWGIAAQSGTAGRLEGGLRCDVVLVLGLPDRTCVLGLYALVGGVDTELCTVIAYPGGSGTQPQVRLRTTGTTATLSVVGSGSSCTATVPAALQAQTRVGVGATSSVALNLLGNPTIILQVTAVPAAWTQP